MSTRRSKSRPPKVFACQGYGDCHMTFTRSEHLARHIRKHTGERPFRCSCGRSFSRLDNLRQHAHTVHANIIDQEPTPPVEALPPPPSSSFPPPPSSSFPPPPRFRPNQHRPGPLTLGNNSRDYRELYHSGSPPISPTSCPGMLMHPLPSSPFALPSPVPLLSYSPAQYSPTTRFTDSPYTPVPPRLAFTPPGSLEDREHISLPLPITHYNPEYAPDKTHLRQSSLPESFVSVPDVKVPEIKDVTEHQRLPPIRTYDEV